MIKEEQQHQLFSPPSLGLIRKACLELSIYIRGHDLRRKLRIGNVYAGRSLSCRVMSTIYLFSTPLL